MNVSAEDKCTFAELKYEQLLSEKYFIETCFSKKFESYTSKQKLIDLFTKIKCIKPRVCITVDEICPVYTTSTTTTTTEASTTTTTTT